MKIMKILLLTLFMACGTLFANNVATITAIKGDASIKRGADNIKATLGAKLQEKDSIITKENTKLQIIFKDETIISIGKNSNFSIKEYIFDDKQEPTAKFGMIKGAMRTITGKIGKIAPQKFSVELKTATIGIRGTNFSVVLGNDGSYNAFCTFGAISVTINSEVNVVQQGYFVSVSPTGKVEVKEFTPKDLKDMKKENFGSNGKTKGMADKGSVASTKNQNNEQIDLTKSDYSDIIITDVTDATVTSIQDAQDTAQEIQDKANLSELIESYTMSDAIYAGTYTMFDGNTALGSNGDATLNVDFGADTAELILQNVSPIVYYNQNSHISGSSFSAQTYDEGYGVSHANGMFHGPSGNHVTGSFDYHESGNSDSGTFDVSTSQTLH